MRQHLQRLRRTRLMLLLGSALIFPGLPQLLRKRLISGSFLFIAGSGALLNLGICAFLSGEVFQSFDTLYVLMTPNFSRAFPDLLQISGESVGKFTQPWFWGVLAGHVLIYLCCAGISVWQQWRQVRSSHASR